MNKLIPTALFSSRDAEEQRLREAMQAYDEGHPLHGDCTNYSRCWDNAAEGFRRNDPDGRKLAELLRRSRK